MKFLTIWWKGSSPPKVGKIQLCGPVPGLRPSYRRPCLWAESAAIGDGTVFLPEDRDSSSHWVCSQRSSAAMWMHFTSFREGTYAQKHQKSCSYISIPMPQSSLNIIIVTPPSLLRQRDCKTVCFIQKPGRAPHTPLCLRGVLDCFSSTLIASAMSKECKVI